MHDSSLRGNDRCIAQVIAVLIQGYKPVVTAVIRKISAKTIKRPG